MVVEIVAALVTAFLVVRSSGAVIDHLIYRQKRLFREQQQRHRLELLDKAGGVVSLLLVDKEMGEAVFKQLLGQYGELPAPPPTPLLTAHQEEEEQRTIMHFRLRGGKTRCGLKSSDTVHASKRMGEVTCKRCSHLLIMED